MVTTILTPPQKQVHPEPLVTLRGISWQTYKTLLAEIGEDRICRITYDRGVLEIRMPLEEHEEPKGLIEHFVAAIVDELEIEMRQLGALTLEREDLTRAVEPDTCFYIQNESLVRGKKINLPDVPAPDLVVESDYTSSSINKFSLYGALGVPELWRYRKNSLEVYQLREGKYERVTNSIAFPFLPIAEIPELIQQSQTMGQRAVVRLFKAKIKEILARENEQ